MMTKQREILGYYSAVLATLSVNSTANANAFSLRQQSAQAQGSSWAGAAAGGSL